MTITRTSTGLLESPGALFYYLRERVLESVDHNGIEIWANRPYACVAIRHTGRVGLVCRGISLCSKNDNFNKVKGRALAYKRLRLAEDPPEGHVCTNLQDKRLKGLFRSSKGKIQASSTGAPTVFEVNLLEPSGE